MAIAIKSIPTLQNKAAKSFNKNAVSSSKKRESVNFSKEVSAANKILAKAFGK